MSELPNLDRFQDYLDSEATKTPNESNKVEESFKVTNLEELPLNNDSMNFENPVIELFEELDERLTEDV